MKYVFGPVPSRRLGRSLGIDPVPFKTCNWNCVYCQLGRTTPMTNVRREFFPRFEIVAEVADTLAGPAAGEIDWITFVGSGEPLLHAGLGAMIREVKSLTPLPVAVITNGSLLYQRKIQEELMAADAVLPTLDVGSAKLYQTIKRWPIWPGFWPAFSRTRSRSTFPCGHRPSPGWRRRMKNGWPGPGRFSAERSELSARTRNASTWRIIAKWTTPLSRWSPGTRCANNSCCARWPTGTGGRSRRRLNGWPQPAGSSASAGPERFFGRRRRPATESAVRRRRRRRGNRRRESWSMRFSIW